MRNKNNSCAFAIEQIKQSKKLVPHLYVFMDFISYLTSLCDLVKEFSETAVHNMAILLVENTKLITKLLVSRDVKVISPIHLKIIRTVYK